MFLFCKLGGNFNPCPLECSLPWLQGHMKIPDPLLSRIFKEDPMIYWVYSIHYWCLNYHGPFGSLKATSLTALSLNLDMGFGKTRNLTKLYCRDQQSRPPSCLVTTPSKSYTSFWHAHIFTSEPIFSYLLPLRLFGSILLSEVSVPLINIQGLWEMW